MQDFSMVDGFAEVNKSFAEMIKYLANEPSLGLFFVQQHVRNATPALVSTKESIARRLHELVQEIDDLEDSLSMLKSMKYHGFSIVSEMASDIQESICVLSTHQQRNSSGFAENSSSALKNLTTRSVLAIKSSRMGSIWRPGEWAPQYSSSLLSSCSGEQLKDANTLISGPIVSTLDNKTPSSSSHTTSSLVILDTSSIETEELPVSSTNAGGMTITDNKQLLFEKPQDYEEFRMQQRVKLEKWLEDNIR